MPAVGDLIVSRLVDPSMGIIENVYFTPPASGEFVLGMDSSGVPTCFKDATGSNNGLMTAAQATAVSTMGSSPTIQRTKVTTNSAGVYTWTFPTAFSAAPIISCLPQDNTSGVSVDAKVTSVSSTSVTIQVSKVSTVLGVLTLAATPGATDIHLVAFSA